MDTGPFFSGTIYHPNATDRTAHTTKAIAIRLGDRQQASICFDSELLRFSCGWTGGFLKINPARFGLITPPVLDGVLQFSTPLQPGCTASDQFEDRRGNPPYGPLPREFAHYEGLHLHGNRVVLQYTVGTTRVLESPWVIESEKVQILTREMHIAPSRETLTFVVADGKTSVRLFGQSGEAKIVRTETGLTQLNVPAHDMAIRLKLAIFPLNVAQANEVESLLRSTRYKLADLEGMLKDNPPRWGGPLVTRGVISDKSDPYVLDTLTVPFENRYRALMFLSGHDFFQNGDAAVCTVHGDVWRVSGIDDRLERITWRRFATGLFQPLGLKVVQQPDGRELVHVLGRDQITILHDHNGDGEADFYQNFNNDGQTTTNSHEFATCLETDSKGNFYYLKGDSGSQTAHDGCLLRVTPDGKKLDVFATGFRNANGLSIGPDDTITVAPQEGNWTPGSAIFQVRQGGFYGAMQSHHRPVAPTTFDPPICWIPRLQDNSSGGQTWVTDNRWGLPAGQLLHFSFGTCRMFLVVRELLESGRQIETDGVPQVQGGLVQFPLLFDSGVMRGRFRTQDGQLYVTGLKGWVSSAVQDGCFQRVRYTGRAVDLPVKQQTFANGVALTFSEPLDRATAEDPDNYVVEAWNYVWSGNYGSPEMKVTQPTQVGRDELEVVSATLLSDGKTVYVELPDLRPAMQVGITYTLKAAAGRPIQQVYHATLHKLGPDPFPEPLTRRPRPGQLAKEIEQALQPGLKLKIESRHAAQKDAVHTEQGVSRLAAYYLPKKVVESVVLPNSELKATWTGFLKVPQKSEYEFRIETRGRATLKLSERDVPLNEPVLLRRGFQPLSLQFSGSNSEIDVRLMWKSASFPWEAVPPHLLSHLPDPELSTARLVRTGQDLYRQHGCANCHTSETDRSEYRIVAPNLDGLTNRLNGPWLAAWIQQPRQLRPEAAMPSLFNGHAANADRQTVNNLVAFLTAQSTPTQSSTNAEPGDVETGLQLYESLGCIGCHRFTPPAEVDPFQRVSLHFVSAKFQTGRLAEFLTEPRRHAPLSRMPDFRLKANEASALEAYLRSMSQGQIAPAAELAAGDAKRGQQQFESLGCRHCHQLTKTDKPLPGKQRLVWGREPLHGCLIPKIPVDSTAPRYHLTESERTALVQFMATNTAEPGERFDVERGQRFVKEFRCAACHSRDGQNSPLAELLAEEGQGLPPEPIPHLTWAGEKLRASWVNRLVNGRLEYQTRPWLKARMPSFPDNQFARYLAPEHGIRFDVEPPVTLDPPAQIELGKQLTLKGQGLDCRQCHGVGTSAPSGDKSTLISMGINFSVIADRMNPEFFPRLILNPPRYDPNSRMPVFAVDGKTTAAKGILNGNAEQQYEAIWTYLKTLKP